MTTPINDGGPAFPTSPSGDSMQFEDGRISHQYPAMSGMSLRDWFAGQALASRGMYSANVRENEVAAECYQIADAMLAAREKVN